MPEFVLLVIFNLAVLGPLSVAGLYYWWSAASLSRLNAASGPVKVLARLKSRRRKNATLHGTAPFFASVGLFGSAMFLGFFGSVSDAALLLSLLNVLFALLFVIVCLVVALPLSFRIQSRSAYDISQGAGETRVTAAGWVVLDTVRGGLAMLPVASWLILQMLGI